MSSLLLLSGGIDSVALAAWLKPSIGLTINYGQRCAEAEIHSATQVAKALSIKHIVMDINIGSLGSGDLAKTNAVSHSANSEFWPYRNQFLITIGAMIAINNNCKNILIGSVSSDCRHRDGSTEFVDTIDSLVALQEGGIRIQAPAIELTTNQLIEKSKISEDILHWAHSCHRGNLACGRCPGCIKHSEVMSQMGVVR
ncbi:7-cyano-7-deazaguanine synthase [Photobacterium ganghwense]|uniref:7-cyano-7-deazaguanine synthase n=1 Tax=Photobacterium ganghwense TaxID=320778 RepID=UPI001A8FEEA6|nr:7-cyano-7-deazaguanine synthase [Photobacterium ganghwense]QSV13780.1 7-cyano-7-deazaguanine synthase [Photobacterium ganghwense]